MSRPAQAKLYLNHLLHNVHIMQRKIGTSKLTAMVKANAYGHGIRSVSLRLQDHVNSFGVASIDEAIMLRKVGIKKSIILMEGIFEPYELNLALQEQFCLVFHTTAQLNWLEASNLKFSSTLWLKVDTGMGRLGFLPEQALAAYTILQNHVHKDGTVGIMSHLGMAENINNPITQKQLDFCYELIKTFPGPFSFANSAGIFTIPSLHKEYVRPGIALYGISPFANSTGLDLDLKPVMQLQSSIIAIKTVPKGHAVGYTGSFICPEKMPVGIVALGYGDGYPRSAKQGTPLLIADTLCPLIGNVSMDMLAVDLRALPTAKVGDQVIAWGAELPVEIIAQHAATIPFDLVTRLQNRITCRWIE